MRARVAGGLAAAALLAAGCGGGHTKTNTVHSTTTKVEVSPEQVNERLDQLRRSHST